MKRQTSGEENRQECFNTTGILYQGSSGESGSCIKHSRLNKYQLEFKLIWLEQCTKRIVVGPLFLASEKGSYFLICRSEPRIRDTKCKEEEGKGEGMLQEELSQKRRSFLSRDSCCRNDPSSHALIPCLSKLPDFKPGSFI